MMKRNFVRFFAIAGSLLLLAGCGNNAAGGAEGSGQAGNSGAGSAGNYPFNGIWAKDEVIESNFESSGEYLYFDSDGTIYSFVYPEKVWMLSDKAAYLGNRGITNVEYTDNQVRFYSNTPLTRDSKEDGTFPDDMTIMVLEKDEDESVDGIYDIVCCEKMVTDATKCYLKDTDFFFLKKKDDLSNYEKKGDVYEKEFNTVFTTYELENDTTMLRGANTGEYTTFLKAEDTTNFYCLPSDGEYATDSMSCNSEVAASTIKAPKFQLGDVVLSFYTMKNQDVIDAFAGTSMEGITLDSSSDRVYFVCDGYERHVAELFFDNNGYFIKSRVIMYNCGYPIYTFGGLSPLNKTSTRAQVIEALQNSGLADRGKYTGNLPGEVSENGDFYVTDSTSGVIYGYYRLDQPVGGPQTESINQVVFIFDSEDNLVSCGWDPNSDIYFSRLYVGANSLY